MCSYFIACTYINYNYMPTHTYITPLFVYNNKITRYLNACNAIKYARLCVTVAGRSMPMAIMQLFAYTHFVFSRSSAALLSGARAHNSFLSVLFSLLLDFFPFFLFFFFGLFVTDRLLYAVVENLQLCLLLFLLLSICFKRSAFV